MKIQLKRSSVLEEGGAKEPLSTQMEYGELAVNFNADDPALFIKDSTDGIIRLAGLNSISIPDWLPNPEDGGSQGGTLDDRYLSSVNDDTCAGSITFQSSCTFNSGITGDLTGNVVGNVTGDLTGNADSATTCSKSVVGGDGLSGGGVLTSNRTLSVQAANNTINVSASGISVAESNIEAGNAEQADKVLVAHGTTTSNWKRPLFCDDALEANTYTTAKSAASATVGIIPGSGFFRAAKFVGPLEGNASTATTATNCSRSISGGSGLTGGGALTANRTLSVGAGSGISVSADAVAVDSTVVRTTGDQSISGAKTFNGTVNIRSRIDLNDGKEISFGSSDDWEASFNSNGWLYINQKASGIIFQDSGTAKMRLEDSGVFRPETDNTCSIGTSSVRWATINAVKVVANEIERSNGTITIDANGSGADVTLSAADNVILQAGAEEDGQVLFRGNSGADSYKFAKSGQTSVEGFLSFESLSADRTYTFPNSSGTIALTTTKVDNADKLDGLSSASFLRADANDTATGTLTFNGLVNIRGNMDLADNDIIRFGSGDDCEFFCNGSHMYIDLNSGIGNLYIRDGSNTRFTFDDNGTFTASSVVKGSQWQGGLRTSDVQNAMASSSANSKGSYALCTSNDQSDRAPGYTRSSGGMRWANCGGGSSTNTISGSWRLMGRTAGTGSDYTDIQASCWLRYA